MEHNKNLNAAEILKNLSRQDFLNFGMREIAYIRPVRLKERRAFAIHAADGTPLSIMDSMDAALTAVRHNDLESSTVH